MVSNVHIDQYQRGKSCKLTVMMFNNCVEYVPSLKLRVFRLNTHGTHALVAKGCNMAGTVHGLSTISKASLAMKFVH